MINELKNFYKENKTKLLVLYLMYAFVAYVISATNYPYIDDIYRQKTGATEFAMSYSRYFSEYFSQLLNGSERLLDLGATSQLLAAIIIATTASIVLFIFTSYRENKELTWLSTFAALFIGLNPWYLEAFSFRFDSPFMAASVLFSVFPFLYWWKWKKFFIFSILGVFLMSNAYQASSGIYIVMVLTLTFLDYAIDGVTVKEGLWSLFLSGIAYIIGIVAFFIETLFNSNIKDNDTASIAKFDKLFETSSDNIVDYMVTVWNQSALHWQVVGVSVLVLGALLLIKQRKNFSRFTLFWSPIYLFVSLVMSYGTYIIFENSLVTWRPRYAYGFGFYFGILLILVSFLGMKGILYYIKNTMIFAMIYYMVSFSFTYAAVLSAQKTEFENQSILLYSDLKNHLVDEDIKRVYVNKLFDNSVMYDSASENYPIIENLVPNNEDNIWTNLTWFSNVTHYYVNFRLYNPKAVDFESLEKLDTNTEFTIYRTGEWLFIEMH